MWESTRVLIFLKYLKYIDVLQNYCVDCLNYCLRKIVKFKVNLGLSFIEGKSSQCRE